MDNKCHEIFHESYTTILHYCVYLDALLCLGASDVVTLPFAESQMLQMECSLAFDLHIMPCLPAFPRLYLLRQNQCFHPKSVTQFCCWAVKVSIAFASQDFSNNLRMQKQEGWGSWGGVEQKDALLLRDVATPRRCRLGSGVLTAAQIPRDDRKKYEQKLQERSTCTTCFVEDGDSSLTADCQKYHE